jgi:hypothetical protein
LISNNHCHFYSSPRIFHIRTHNHIFFNFFSKIPHLYISHHNSVNIHPIAPILRSFESPWSSASIYTTTTHAPPLLQPRIHRTPPCTPPPPPAHPAASRSRAAQQGGAQGGAGSAGHRGRRCWGWGFCFKRFKWCLNRV